VPVKTQPEESDYGEGEESEEEEDEEVAAPATTHCAKAAPERPPEPEGPPSREQLERSRQGNQFEHSKRKRRHGGSSTRGGRKHQRTYRILEQPDLVLHRRKPAAFWDQTPSRDGRAALERRR